MFPGAVLQLEFLFLESAARILQKGFRQPGSPIHASGLLFGPSAARILQKGFRQPLTGPGSPSHASGLLFGPSAARILQKGFRDIAWKYHKTHWYEAVISTVNFPFLKEVSQTCFDFGVVHVKK